MQVYDILSQLIVKGVKLQVCNDQLKVISKPGIITPELGSYIKAHKQELIQVIKGLDANEGHLNDLKTMPRNALDAKLASIWKELFNLDVVGINEDFNALGGTAALEVELLAQLNRQLGLVLTPDVLETNRTIAQITDEIQRQESFKGDFARGVIKKPQKPRAAYLYERADLPNLFFVAPLGIINPTTSMVGMIDMVEYFKDTASLISLQAPPLMPEMLDLIEQEKEIAPESVAFTQTVDSLSDWLIAEIKAKQASGPYYIGGFCTGSILALAISEKLLAQGDEVQKLILIDPPIWVGDAANRQIDLGYTKDEIAGYIANDLGWDTPEMDYDHLLDQLYARSIDLSWDICYDYIKQLNIFDRDFEPVELKQFFEQKYYSGIMLQYYFARHEFTYPKLNVEDTLVMVTQDTFEDVQQVAARYFVGNTKVETIPGHHHNLFMPNYLAKWGHKMNQHIKGQTVSISAV